MSVELRHLRAFVAIAEEGTITAAAQRLHVGQPALSRTLSQLESHLGVRLVDRSTHHLELTVAGRGYLPRVRAALASVQAALEPALADGWPLRLGHAWSAFGEYTAVLLRRWNGEHPRVPLRLLQIENRTAGLAQGRVDVALVRGESTDGWDREAWIRSELLLTESRVAVVPSDSPLASRPDLELADLADYPVAVSESAGTTTGKLWPPARRPTITLVQSIEEWLVTIASGRAVGVSSEATARVHPYPGVVYRPLRDAPVLPVRLAWTEPPTHPAVSELIRVAREVVGRPAAEKPVP
jgi:DNA-binding transcriptional LysR family regulator